MTPFKTAVLLFLILGIVACSSPYRDKPKLTYYHGQTPPEGYITVVRAAETEVEFLIKVVFRADHLYHLLLDGNEPLAEGWFPTARMAASEGYRVILKLREGLRLEPGKSYRLCIGAQSPQAVQMGSDNYRCLVDYSFVFQAK